MPIPAAQLTAASFAPPSGSGNTIIVSTGDKTASDVDFSGGAGAVFDLTPTLAYAAAQGASAYVSLYVQGHGGGNACGVKLLVSNDGSILAYQYGGSYIAQLDGARKFVKLTPNPGGQLTLQQAASGAGPFADGVQVAMPAGYTALVNADADLVAHFDGGGGYQFPLGVVPQTLPLAQGAPTLGLATSHSQPLTWPAATNVPNGATVTYDVQRAATLTPQDTDFSTIAAALTGRSYTDTARSPATPASYRIVAHATVNGTTTNATSAAAGGVTASAPQIVATAKAPDGTVVTGRTCHWRSTDPRIATVSQDGTVTPVAVGVCYIIATFYRRDSRTRTKRCKIVVTP